MASNFDYIRPKSLQEAITHLSAKGAAVHAGGTDLLGCMREDVFEVKKVVSISGLKELRGISEGSGGELRIGALVTLTQVAEHPLVRRRFPGLARGADEAASPQLRNQGTLGGNLCQKPRCWYYRGEFHCLRKGGSDCFAANGENQFHCIFGSGGICFMVHPSDTAPPLVALGAVVRVAGPRGVREIDLERFHVLPEADVRRETVLEPQEILTEVRIPPPAPGTRSAYRKVRARRSWDFALAGVALALQFDGKRVVDGRVVLSGAAPVPWRSAGVEQTLRGKELTDAVVAAAGKAAVTEAEPLEKNKYKIPLFQGIIEEELTRMAAAGGSPT